MFHLKDVQAINTKLNRNSRDFGLFKLQILCTFLLSPEAHYSQYT
jgi:hypothetical protein